MTAFEAFTFWLLKPLAELTIVVACMLVAGAVFAVLQIPTLLRRWRCSHPTVHETGACEAVCRSCGKNLGFIGTWRDSLAARQLNLTLWIELRAGAWEAKR